ncbi:TRI29 protein, partial [Polyodon spathula]|nr:TRI29 protein [Polyodon spathula]
MATASYLHTEELTCPVCLELLNDPVTIACGHSFCRECLENYWGQTDHAEFCCKILCLASSYETYLKPHWDGEAFKRHSLVDPVQNSGERFCPHHERVLKFCRTDQTCICWLCTDQEHQSHDVVLAESAWAEKKARISLRYCYIAIQLGETQTEIQQRTWVRQKELEELKQAVKLLKSSAQRESQLCEGLFTKLICFITQLQDKVTALMEEREQAVVSQAEKLIKKLEQELTELSKRKEDLEQLAETEDQIHFLQVSRL